MKGLIFGVFTIIMLTSARGEKGQQSEQLKESVVLKLEEAFLECFRCDLGFWDACYTTETNCSLGERCFTGRGMAGDVLDIKTLGCAKVEECDMETTVELFFNNTVYAMTKHCCNTPFCNSAHKPSICTLLHLTAAFLTAWHLSKASTGP